MPKLRMTDAERRAKCFLWYYEAGKKWLGLQEPQIADALGISAATLARYKRDPLRWFSGEQLITLKRVFEWTDADFLDILHGGK